MNSLKKTLALFALTFCLSFHVSAAHIGDVEADAQSSRLLGDYYAERGMKKEAINAYAEAVAIYTRAGNQEKARQMQLVIRKVNAKRLKSKFRAENAKDFYAIGHRYAAMGMKREAINAYAEAVAIHTRAGEFNKVRRVQAAIVEVNR